MRRTLATRAVLGLFLANPKSSLNHAQAFASLAARGLDINRVTLYRLLDRLVACSVLQRHADDDARTWYFCLADTGQDSRAPRFECDGCHSQFRLPEAGAQAAELARTLFQTLSGMGHQGQRLDLLLHGTCATCLAQAGSEAGA
ncbi:hypothetical protein LPB072_07815 [Hydrogenophaga crassostreae]|uniref:Fur family transcriptional regulator n=1 Tax=Hydrogenophaga crassostreae TaxID=1763535 RepID=A0A1D8P2C8_9BURK|nr:hypothetical protein LPB072_07815 [Hydrogenophaga crassostreae]